MENWIQKTELSNTGKFDTMSTILVKLHINDVLKIILLGGGTKDFMKKVPTATCATRG